MCHLQSYKAWFCLLNESRVFFSLVFCLFQLTNAQGMAEELSEEWAKNISS